jgi:hypothetical protein
MAICLGYDTVYSKTSGIPSQLTVMLRCLSNFNLFGLVTFVGRKENFNSGGETDIRLSAGS